MKSPASWFSEKGAAEWWIAPWTGSQETPAQAGLDTDSPVLLTFSGLSFSTLKCDVGLHQT